MNGFFLAKHAALLKAALVLGAALTCAACASNAAVSDALSPAELIQRAQEAADRNRYKLALQYYHTLLERNSTNLDLVCVAEYEIAYIYYKQKKYPEAKAGMKALLARYNAHEEELLPPQFKRLATIVLERIEEKEKGRPALFRKKTPVAG
jgi:outer membrane protein assembly factor BamD (BamD/ComL family)